MASQKLPLQIRLGIRDHFDKPACPVRKAFGVIENTVGIKIVCNIEWELILNELGADFPDKSTLVPTVCNLIVVWCDSLSARLENDAFVTWTDQVVEKLEAVGTLKLQIQTYRNDRPSTAWLDTHSAFVILLPHKASFAASTAASCFSASFATLFEANEDDLSSQTRSHEFATRLNDERQADHDWDDVEGASSFSDVTSGPGMPLMTPSVTTISRSNTFGPPPVERMPLVSSAPNPETFLRNATPYLLYVTQRGSSRLIEQSSGRVFDQGSSRFGHGSTSTQVEQGGNTIVVQGTHEPTLQFLNEYLSRWIKKDYQDTRKCPLLRITLHESPFGLGLMYDSLSITPYDVHQERRGVQMNPTMIVSIIENILGYRCQPRVSAGVWEFKRELPFK